jgi:hypothetical protein
LKTEYAVNGRRSADELQRRIRLHTVPHGRETACSVDRRRGSERGRKPSLPSSGLPSASTRAVADCRRCRDRRTKRRTRSCETSTAPCIHGIRSWHATRRRRPHCSRGASPPEVWTRRQCHRDAPSRVRLPSHSLSPTRRSADTKHGFARARRRERSSPVARTQSSRTRSRMPQTAAIADEISSMQFNSGS